MLFRLYSVYAMRILEVMMEALLSCVSISRAVALMKGCDCKQSALSLQTVSQYINNSLVSRK